MPQQDYYQILGVSRDATAEQIRKAFKKIARENHPDAKKDDPAAAERFKAAAEAYDVLGDEEKRKKYDQFGANWKHFKDGQSPYAGGGSGGGGGNPFRSGGPVDVDLRDIFGGQGAVDLEEIFGGMFGGGGGRRSAGRGRAPRPQKGEDLSATIQVPFQTAAVGGNYDLSLQRNGKPEELSVKIPVGIEDGQTIRLGGQGEPGHQGGPAGDLLLTVQVAPHPYFRREGRNVLVDVPVSMTEAALGTKIDVPTLSDGIVSMTLPAGTSSGAKLRLKGKGIEHPKSGTRGDLFVLIKIVVPKGLDARSKELLEEFAELNPLTPRAGLW
ncbi:DnaJ C-terminal domain-containing protein [Planctomicrobium piriforme]|uniref:Curved DNA-binding protein n=1 Tax=Planctomicrobium piriforme TaxID=1576369 RepID=A0A1I3RQ53_9PLAN|nr:DnaJ C-terminal domain-containing protein [Planctomicrobium piriforme]SFJ48180.1 curved DNA-binding protein [Planctomicrobium piriforme]